MRNRTRMIAGLALVATIAGAAMVGVLSDREQARQGFNQDLWKRRVDWCVESPRSSMVKDLVSQKLKAGRPMNEVRQLLGPPDEVFSSGWVYHVGREFGGLLDACVNLELRTRGVHLGRVLITRDN